MVTHAFGWPAPPHLPQPWMTRRAVWWLRLMRAGQVRRFQTDVTAATAGRRDRMALALYGDALRQEWRRRVEAGPAGPALRRADHPNYLGDRAVVRGLVDGWIALLIARAGGAVPHEAVAEETHRLARIFAGAERDYAPIGGWNTRALLGEAAIEHAGLDPAAHATVALEPLLGEAFGAVGLGALRVLRAADGGRIGTDAALARLSAVSAELSDTLLGLHGRAPVAAAVADLPEL